MQPNAELSSCLSAAPEPKPFTLAAGVAIALPPNWSIPDLEKYLALPLRTRQAVKVRSMDDFVAYVARFAGDASTIFVNPSLTSLSEGGTLALAVIDYHGQSRAAWGSHTCEYQPTASPAYALLCAIDGKILPQEDFAQRLRDLARFCTSHAAADLLETVRTLTLTSRGEYASLNDDISGSIRLGYDVQVEARAGTAQRTLEIPREITFTVPVFLGDVAPREIKAELIYRVPKQAGGSVQLGIRMPDRLWLEHDLITATAKTIGERTQLLTVTGTR